MTDSPRDRDHADEKGRMPRNRARTLILLTLLVIFVVAFGYMLVVSQTG
ncbi:hypothetical protein [Modestobacter lapidis]|nr:hypothetical protein [Modestobacter lapidis]